MIKIKYFKEQNFLYAHFFDRIGMEEIIDYYQNLINSDDYPDELYILQDENHAEFVESKKLINRATELVKDLADRYTIVRVAIWQTTPVKVAYGTVFIEDINIPNYQANLFYSKEAALKWLLSNRAKT